MSVRSRAKQRARQQAALDQLSVGSSVLVADGVPAPVKQFRRRGLSQLALFTSAALGAALAMDARSYARNLKMEQLNAMEKDIIDDQERFRRAKPCNKNNGPC